MVRILILAANPTDTSRIRLDQEVRAIDSELQSSKYRNLFNWQSHSAVRISDLQQLLLRHEPDIIHFCGHGTDASELILEDNTGKMASVPSAALTKLFELLGHRISCVVLNSCYSTDQANEIAKFVDCVVGNSGTVSDEAAIHFAEAFYRSIGYGQSVAMAFRLGCNQLNLYKMPEADRPKLHGEANAEKITFVAAKAPSSSMPSNRRRLSKTKAADQKRSYSADQPKNVRKKKQNGNEGTPATNPKPNVAAKYWTVVVSTLNFTFTSELPRALQRGRCYIEVRSSSLFNFNLELSHETILSELLIGIGTHPSWHTRRFISPLDDTVYQLNLAGLSVRINSELAIEFCQCVDVIAEKYKQALLSTDTALQAWDSWIGVDGKEYGYVLCSVAAWLWILIKRFADLHESLLGETNWHIFYTTRISIAVQDLREFYFEIMPKIEINSWNDNLPSSYVELLYRIPSTYAKRYKDTDDTQWDLRVGTNGIWNVQRTKEWLLKKLLPAVKDAYPKEFAENSKLYGEPVLNINTLLHMNFKNVNALRDLANYLHVVQYS